MSMAVERRPATLAGRMMARLGGAWIPLTIAVVQLISNLGLAPVAYFVEINAELPLSRFASLVQLIVGLVLINNLLLLLWMYLSSREAHQSLSAWAKQKPLPYEPGAAQRAWRQITSLPWRYSITATLSSIAIVIAPLLAAERFIYRASLDQQIYTLIGSTIGLLGIITLSYLLLEDLLQPARLALLPHNTEDQLKGMLLFPLLWKFVLISVVLVSVSALLIAPIGYHETTEVLYYEVGSLEVLRELQVRSFIVSLAALALGAAYSLLMARSLTNPLTNLLEAFAEVERGNLGRRVAITTTGEVGQLLAYFNRMVTRLQDFQENLEKQVQERTALLKASYEVGQVISSILNPEELLQRVANLIGERFGFYYVAVFLLDESGRWAELREATGEAGRVLKASGHRLEVGGKSMVGTAISTRQARVALDVGAEPVRFDNPLLPYTRSEMALPLMVGERVLGALDVQSTKQAAFGAQEIETLQSMANQVAIAIENARLFESAQRSLEEMQAIQRQYIREAWRPLSGEPELEYRVGDETGAAAPEIEIPLALRDEIIGKIALAAEGEWTPEQRSLIEAVATQAALALENARLVEESQRTAAYERLVSELTQKIWMATTVDGILLATARELGRALGASEAMVELQVEQEPGLQVEE